MSGTPVIVIAVVTVTCMIFLVTELIDPGYRRLWAYCQCELTEYRAYRERMAAEQRIYLAQQPLTPEEAHQTLSDLGGCPHHMKSIGCVYSGRGNPTHYSLTMGLLAMSYSGERNTEDCYGNTTNHPAALSVRFDGILLTNCPGQWWAEFKEWWWPFAQRVAAEAKRERDEKYQRRNAEQRAREDLARQQEEQERARLEALTGTLRQRLDQRPR